MSNIAVSVAEETNNLCEKTSNTGLCSHRQALRNVFIIAVPSTGSGHRIPTLTVGTPDNFKLHKPCL